MSSARPQQGLRRRVVDPSEPCDDGNSTPGDRCDALFRIEEEPPPGEVRAPSPLPGCLAATKAKVALSDEKAGSES